LVVLVSIGEFNINISNEESSVKKKWFRFIFLLNFLFLTSCITTLSDRIYSFDSKFENNYSYIYGRFINNGSLLIIVSIENMQNKDFININFDNFTPNFTNTEILIKDPVIDNIFFTSVRKFSKKIIKKRIYNS